MLNCKVLGSLLIQRRLYSQKCRKSRTYYEVLNVDKDCSSKDIRSAFVELTKKFHPDVSGNKTDNQFITITEAYNVLSKPELRAAYDRQLRFRLGPQSYTTGRTTEMHRPWEIHPDYDPSPKPYYGIRGVSRMSNVKIALLLFIVAVSFGIIGFASVSRAFSMQRAHYDRRSSEASSHHEAVRTNAEKYGNEEQLRRMAHKMLGGEFKAGINSQDTNATKQI